MKTKKEMLRIVDEALLCAYEDEWLSFGPHYEEALMIAEELHGCRLYCMNGAVYELHKVYTRVAVMPSDERKPSFKERINAMCGRIVAALGF